MRLQVDQLTKSYGTERVLRSVSFSVESGEILSVLGRSGGGKTTLLRCIAGLENPDTGSLRFGTERLDSLPAYRRNIVYLYQEALLFPHLTAAQNIAFGLRLKKLRRSEIDQQVGDLLAALGLQQEADKMPEQLSGGQRQRVNFGRALAVAPRLLLLDEPFGALDVETRASMQNFFLEIAAQRQLTAIFVTHDLKEALRMGQRLGYLENGELYIYPDRDAFIHDPRTGAQRERKFWRELGKSGA